MRTKAVPNLLNRVLSLVVILSFSISLKLGAQTEEFSLNSDSASMENGVLTYSGNVKYTDQDMRIDSQTLSITQNPAGVYTHFLAKGKPAVLVMLDPKTQTKTELRANLVSIAIQDKILKADTDATLVQETSDKERTQINAQFIQIVQAHEEQGSIQARGNPLELVLAEHGKNDLVAKAKNLEIQSSTRDVVLKGEVVASQKDSTIKSGTFRFNRDTKKSSFERSKDQQVEMILKKKNEQ